MKLQNSLNEVPLIELFERFYYDKNSPSKLCYKTITPYSRGVKVGDTVGYVHKSGYWKCRLSKKSFLISRLICELFGVSTKGKSVDHINGDKLDNSIENLRVVDFSVNTQNRGMLSNNTSGVMGVSINDKGGGYLYWKAQISENGKIKNKHFSITEHGNEKAFQLACEWRINKLLELNQGGTSYSDRHLENSSLSSN